MNKRIATSIGNYLRTAREAIMEAIDLTDDAENQPDPPEQPEPPEEPEPFDEATGPNPTGPEIPVILDRMARVEARVLTLERRDARTNDSIREAVTAAVSVAIGDRRPQETASEQVEAADREIALLQDNCETFCKTIAKLKGDNLILDSANSSLRKDIARLHSITAAREVGIAELEKAQANLKHELLANTQTLNNAWEEVGRLKVKNSRLEHLGNLKDATLRRWHKTAAAKKKAVKAVKKKAVRSKDKS